MAISAKIVGINLIEAQLVKAFQEWAEEDVDDAYMAQKFLDPGEWDYDYPNPPGYTERKSGEIVRSPRNIFDTGELYRSGRRNFTVEGPSASWLWDATNAQGTPYAWYVHEGIGTNMTERRWTDDISIPAKFEAGIEKLKLIDRISLQFKQL
jgi:hypothetical protein